MNVTCLPPLAGPAIAGRPFAGLNLTAFAAMRAKTGNLSFGYGAHIVFNGTYWVVWLLGGHGLPFEVSELLR